MSKEYYQKLIEESNRKLMEIEDRNSLRKKMAIGTSVKLFGSKNLEINKENFKQKLRLGVYELVMWNNRSYSFNGTILVYFDPGLDKEIITFSGRSWRYYWFDGTKSYLYNNQNTYWLKYDGNNLIDEIDDIGTLSLLKTKLEPGKYNLSIRGFNGIIIVTDTKITFNNGLVYQFNSSNTNFFYENTINPSSYLYFNGTNLIDNDNNIGTLDFFKVILDLKNEITLLESENSNLNSQIVNLNKRPTIDEFNQLTSDNNRLTSDNNRLTSDNNRLTSDNQLANNEINRLNESNKKLESVKEELESAKKEINRLNISNKNLESEKEDLNNEVNTIEKESKILNAVNKGLEDEVISLEKEIRNLSKLKSENKKLNDLFTTILVFRNFKNNDFIVLKEVLQNSNNVVKFIDVTLINVNWKGLNLSNILFKNVKSEGIVIDANTRLHYGYRVINGYLVGPSTNLENVNLEDQKLGDIASGDIIINENTKFHEDYKFIDGYIIGPNVILENVNLENTDKEKFEGILTSGIIFNNTTLPDGYQIVNSIWRGPSDMGRDGGCIIGPGLKLQVVLISDQNFEGINLENITLRAVHFKNVNFKNANFRNSTIRNVRFIDCQLEGADFTGTTIPSMDGWKYYEEKDDWGFTNYVEQASTTYNDQTIFPGFNFDLNGFIKVD